MRRTHLVVDPAISAANGKALNRLDFSSLFKRTEKFTEGDFPLAAHKVIDSPWLVGLRGKTRIVSANDNLHIWFQGAHQFHDPPCRSPLESHNGQADDLRLQLLH